MTDERTHGGEAFRNDTIDLSRALGARQPVIVDLTDFGGALREWVRGDARRLQLLSEIVAANGERESGAHGDKPSTGRSVEHALALDLSDFLLAKLPPFPFDGDEPDRDERASRVCAAVGTVARGHPTLLEAAEGGTACPRHDRPVYEAADFWAATERPRPRRQARCIELDPDGAHLAREWDLGRMLHPRPEERATPIPGTTPIVEITEDGSELEYLFDRTLHLPREVRRRHVLFVGPTGCGKTTRSILPLIRGDIADPELTVVVLDTKGELLPAVRAFARDSRPGQEVQVVQFRDPARSLGWNPLERVKSHADALALAHHLCHAAEGVRRSSDSVFWINNAIDVLSAFIVALKRKFGDQANIADCLRLTDLGVAELRRFASEFEDLPALKRFASYLESGSHNAETIIADLRMRLVLWRDEAVAATTSADEVDFEGLCRRPSILVLQVPEEDVEELRPLLNAWIDQLLSTALATARDAPGLVLPVQMSVFIEEFASSIGRIPKFERRLNTVRQPGISITASVQSIWQIADEYGTAFRSVMAGFSTRVVFPGCIKEDAEWFSEQSGEMFVMETTTTVEEEYDPEGRDPQGRPLDPPLGHLEERPPRRRRVRSERPVQRPLLTPGQIQRPPINQMLGRAVTWFGPDIPPFQVFLTPLFSMVGGGAQLRFAGDLGARGPLRAEALAAPVKELLGGEGTTSTVPREFTNTSGWTGERIRQRIEDVKRALDIENTTGSALKWWNAFESENQHRAALVLRLAEELHNRKVTITEFFLAYVYSNTDNIQANLHYLDYSTLKKKEEREKKAAAKAREERKQRDPEEEHDGAQEMDPTGNWLDPDEGWDDDAGGDVPLPDETSREDRLRYWVQKMLDESWTYAQTAEESGFTVGTLRYWRKKLSGS